MRQDLTWNLAGALLLACSLTMLTDFTHRMLGADPDSVGILSISVQAMFTVAATSTFTKTGWSWIQAAVSRFEIGTLSRSRWRFVLTATLFALVCPLWLWLPSRLAGYYNDQGFRLQNKDSADAFRNYERAIALDPRLSRAHFNLGELLEASFQYGDAAAHYQKAIVADRQFVKGYNNLSRVLLLEDKATTALRVTDDALKLGPSDPETLTALHKNRAWAEYDLGFYEQALADANLSLQSQPDATAGYCLQGKIYGKVGKRAEAKVAWENFDRLMASPSGPQPMIEPDCIRLAEVSRESH